MRFYTEWPRCISPHESFSSAESSFWDSCIIIIITNIIISPFSVYLERHVVHNKFLFFLHSIAQYCILYPLHAFQATRICIPKASSQQ